MKIGNRVGNDFKRTPEEQVVYNNSMPPSGSYYTRCIGVYNIGTHEEEWKGVKKMTPKVLLDFELYGPGTLHVFDEKLGPQPWTVQKEMTFTNLPSGTLSKVLKAWYNSDPVKVAEIESGELVLEPLLGKVALIGMTKKAKATKPDEMKMVIDTISPPMAGYENNVPEKPYNPLRIFDLDAFDLQNVGFVDLFFSIPGFIRKKCVLSREIVQKGITMESLQKMFPDRFKRDTPSAPSQAPSVTAPQNVPMAAIPQKVMTAKANGMTRDQFVAVGWTDETLVREGYMTITQPAPVMAAPVMQAPILAPPVLAPPVSVPKHQMTAKANGASYEAFIAQGWNDQQLIDNGYMNAEPSGYLSQTWGTPGHNEPAAF